MKMINVMQRLADLDAVNPNVVKEANKPKEKTRPISGSQKKEKTMENLNLESLRYLSGLKNTIAECGMMGGGGQPASINITAGSGQELTGMLKDIMNLAGVSKVEPHHMPVDSPDAGPSTVISAPAMAGAGRHKIDPNAEMHKLMAIVDGPDMIQDSMNSDDQGGEGNEEAEEGLVGGAIGGTLGAVVGGPAGAAAGYSAGSKMGDDLTAEENDRMYDTSPDEKVMGDPMAQFGDINSGDHRERQKGLPVAKPMETTFKQLMADYEQFIAEGKMSYDKKTGQMKKDTTDSDQRHGLYINGKLVKTCNTKDEAANTKKRDPKFKTATVKKISEGKVKDLDADLKDKSMSDEAFKAKYKMTRAEARANLKNKKVKESNHTQYYTDLNPEKKKPGIGSKIAGAAKKVFNKIGHADDDELISKLERQTGGKRPNRYNK
jgi:hypothetical protein